MFGVGVAAHDDPQTLDRVWAMLEGLVRQGVVERLPGAVANSDGLRRGDAEQVVTRALDATCLQVARGWPVYRPDQYLTKAAHREAKRTRQRQAGFETVDPDEDLLAQMLALNLSIAELEQAGGAVRGPGPHGLANTTRTTWRIEPVHRLA